tara:strand:- start:292 stop:438 length:147 start_codon:yes stop_codon:yes gene_type:complete
VKTFKATENIKPLAIGKSLGTEREKKSIEEGRFDKTNVILKLFRKDKA